VPAAVPVKALLAAGVALLIVGLERLLNAFLVGQDTAGWSVRILAGVLCTGVGVLLLALSWYMSRPARR
jgi:hypothetical protein